MLGGIRVIESVMAVDWVPRVKHTKTRSMSEAYHARVQKKWTKRWGTRSVPGAYMLEGHTLVAHPEIIKALQEEIDTVPEPPPVRSFTNFGCAVTTNHQFLWSIGP